MIDLFADYISPDDGAIPLGIHLKSPYLKLEKTGAHPDHHLRVPAPQKYQPWLESRAVKLITVAPELPGALVLIQRGRRFGVEFAVGHSAAS